MYCFQTYESLYVVMEFFPCGDTLYNHLGKQRKFSQQRAKFYSAEILLALGYMHSKKILYRDLLPENVWIDKQGHVKLTDFGLVNTSQATVNHRGKIYTLSFDGVMEYLAPEILLQRGCGRGVDWWSFGILLYEMLNGIPPFWDENVNKMYNKILHGLLHLSPKLSKEAKSLIVQLLQRDPAKRLGSGRTDAREIQNHQFFDDYTRIHGKWKQLYHRKINPPIDYDQDQVEGEIATHDGTVRKRQSSFEKKWEMLKNEAEFDQPLAVGNPYHHNPNTPAKALFVCGSQ